VRGWSIVNGGKTLEGMILRWGEDGDARGFVIVSGGKGVGGEEGVEHVSGEEGHVTRSMTKGRGFFLAGMEGPGSKKEVESKCFEN